jgi:cell division protein FtsQ
MLREQVITPRAGRSSNGGAGGGRNRAGEIAQRPVKRSGQRAASGRKQAQADSWRRALAWMPLVGKTLLAVCLGLVIFTVYRTAASSSFFQLRAIDVSGVSQGSEEQLKALVRRGAAAGVWQANLSAISAELERQPWVRTAVVSRVLPSGLRVRITERVPRAVVRTSAGRFVWVDDDGVITGSVAPTQNAPAFFMRGWDESGTESGRTENRRRVEKYLELSREWEAAGVASRVSEVNLDDLRDVRAQLTGDDSQIEVRLGRDDLTKRLKQAVEALDAQRNTPRGAFITYIDMTQGKRAVIGFKSQAAELSGEDGSASENTDEVAPRTTKTPKAAVNSHVTGTKKEIVQPAAKTAARTKRKESPKQPEVRHSNAVVSERKRAIEERPRRVGRNG